MFVCTSPVSLQFLIKNRIGDKISIIYICVHIKTVKWRKYFKIQNNVFLGFKVNLSINSFQDKEINSPEDTYFRFPSEITRHYFSEWKPLLNQVHVIQFLKGHGCQISVSYMNGCQQFNVLFLYHYGIVRSYSVAKSFYHY